MDYRKIYDQIIERAKSDERVKSVDDYYESHHIIPKCLGGDDSEDNLVLLTAKEHFVCHKLLIYIYPNQAKLVYALWMMSNGSNVHRRNHLKVSSRDYELSRKLYIETHSKKMKGRVIGKEIGKKISESKKGFKFSDNSRKKMSDSQKGKVGEKNSFYGKKHTEESKKKISEGVSGSKNGMYGKLPKFNKPTEYINGDLKILMRSTWEFKFAHWLDKNKKKWEYEKHTFKLSSGYTYTPDFLCEGIFYEVKGYMHIKAKEKIEMFKKEYSDKKYIIVDRDYFKKNGIKL